MVCVTLDDAPLKPESPEYAAVIVWTPTTSELVVIEADPEVRPTVANVVLPSVNVTVPVGNPLLDAMTVVKVTLCPNADVEADDDTAANAAARATSCVSDDVLAVKDASPPYVALMLCEPTGRAAVVNVVCALVRALVASVVAPSAIVTVPLGTPLVVGATAIVNVTLCPNTDDDAELAIDVTVDAPSTT